MYGPSEIRCWRICRLSGTYLLYSSGLAEVNGIDTISGKSAAGASRLKTIVVGFGVLMPEMVCEFWKFAMFAAVGGCFLAFAKYAASCAQYCLRPTIVSTKYRSLPTGATGLQKA